MKAFDDLASEWDTPQKRERALVLAQAIHEHVPLTASTRALEIGAGTGLLGLELAGDVGSMLLTDPSGDMLEVADRKIRATGTNNVTTAVLVLPGEPPAGAPFDLAISLMALHHVGDTEATLRSIHDLLAPGGRIALSDLDAEDGSFHSASAPGVHHDGFDQAGLVRVGRGVGFVDVETSIVYEIEKNDRAYPLFLLTGHRR